MPMPMPCMLYVMCTAVWGEKIIDNVFLRAEHFLQQPSTRLEMPAAVGELLRSLPRRVPTGANRRLLKGRICCAKYRVDEPHSLMRCAPKLERDGSNSHLHANGTIIYNEAQSC